MINFHDYAYSKVEIITTYGDTIIGFPDNYEPADEEQEQALYFGDTLIEPEDVKSMKIIN